MSNYRTSADLIEAALFNASEPTNGTSDYNAKALEYLNRVYQSVWLGGSELDPEINEEWHWLLSTTPAVLTLNPAIFAGTVSVTNNSASITFSSAPSVSVQDRFFRTEGGFDIFRIATHTAAVATATLDSVYTGSTAATAGYKVFQLEYDLPAAVLRPVAPMRVYRDQRREIQGVGLMALEDNWPLSRVEGGIPYEYTLVGERRVRFSHYGSETDYIRTDFDYLRAPDDLENSSTSIPAVPFQYRKTLADFVTFKIMVDKNDNRADTYGLMGKSGLTAMQKHNRHQWAIMGREAGHIYPRPDQTSHQLMRRTTTGVTFDY